MATYRKVQRRIRDEAGNVVGGSNFEVRIYSNFGAGTLAPLKLDVAGADARLNPGQPNSGWSAKLTTQLLGTDTSAVVDSTAGAVAGDAFPIFDGVFFHYLVVKTVTDATHLLLEQTPNAAGSPTGAHTYPIGSVLNGPSMYGHWQGYVDVVQDYDLTVKNLTTFIEGSPDQIFSAQTIGVISFQEEGVATGSARGILNAIGPGFTLTDDNPNVRVNLTLDPNGFIVAGTNAGRPAAGVNGRVYFSTDAPIIISRDNSSTWLAGGFQNPMTASGDIIYGGTSGAQTRLAAGANGQHLSLVAGIPAWASAISILDKKVTDTTVNTTTADTAVYTKTIAANLLGALGGLRLKATGNLLNNSGGSATAILKLKFGGTTLFTAAAYALGSGSPNREYWTVEMLLLNSATNAQRVWARILINGIASGTGWVAVGYSSEGYNVAAEDTTANKDVVISTTMSVSNAAIETKCETALLEQV